MKKFTFLIIALCLSLTQAFGFFWFGSPAKSDFAFGSERAWDEGERWFIGFGGGLGLYGLYRNNSILFTPNPRIIGDKPYAEELYYMLDLNFGWQKYTYEKVGYRFSIGFKGYYSNEFGRVTYDNPEVQDKTYRDLGSAKGLYLHAYYDGLFDFFKRGDMHFGMIAGVGIEFGALIINRPEYKETASGAVSNFPIRLGLQVQNGRHIIDLVANISLGGFSFGLDKGGGIDVGSYNSTLTLGYKYLF